MRAIAAFAVFTTAVSLNGAARADCTCRYTGGVVELGAVICLTTPSGQRLARCDMAINNPSWTMLDKACPTAGLQSPPAPRQSQRSNTRS